VSNILLTRQVDDSSPSRQIEYVDARDDQRERDQSMRRGRHPRAAATPQEQELGDEQPDKNTCKNQDGARPDGSLVARNSDEDARVRQRARNRFSTSILIGGGRRMVGCVRIRAHG
jgi:hypothetical protein